MGYGFSITPNVPHMKRYDIRITPNVPHMKRYEIRIINFKNKTNEN
jgi:hypothetical protein